MWVCIYNGVQPHSLASSGDLTLVYSAAEVTLTTWHGARDPGSCCIIHTRCPGYSHLDEALWLSRVASCVLNRCCLDALYHFFFFLNFASFLKIGSS